MSKISEDHLAARRRQILDGVRRCFAEYDYDKAIVCRLEEAVGMSRGAIFHHFRDRDTLFFTLAYEDAERMADVAVHAGLIQVMRDMLAAPNQCDWLVTRLEIARKLRTDPAFSRGWVGTVPRSWPRRQQTGCVDKSRPAECATIFRATYCNATWTWCSTDWWLGLRPAKTRNGYPQSSIWWRTRCATTSLRQIETSRCYTMSRHEVHNCHIYHG